MFLSMPGYFQACIIVKHQFIAGIVSDVETAAFLSGKVTT